MEHMEVTVHAKRTGQPNFSSIINYTEAKRLISLDNTNPFPHTQKQPKSTRTHQIN